MASMAVHRVRYVHRDERDAGEERGPLTHGRLAAYLLVGGRTAAKSQYHTLPVPGGDRWNVRKRIASIPLHCNTIMAHELFA
jgi:hypothetical protein